MKIRLLTLLLYCFNEALHAQTNYNIGAKIDDFQLPSIVSGQTVSLSNFAASEGVVLIFHSINCPFVQMYENRIKQIIQEFEPQKLRFLLVDCPNGQDNETNAKIKSYHQKSPLRSLDYLTDVNKQLVASFAISKVPEVVVLENIKGSFVLSYKGAIDNSPQQKTDPSENYLTNALRSIIYNTSLKVKTKNPTGCAIEDF